MTRCSDTPISWLRLEQLAVGELDAAGARRVREHLSACDACRSALELIESDRRQLRALGPLESWTRRRFRFAGLGVALAAAAALLLFVAIGRGPGGGTERRGGARVAVKGGGELVVSLVRERRGRIDTDPASFLDGDRFKVAVTCSEPGETELDVVVLQGGEAFRPLGRRPSIWCGNRALVPGAFRVTGAEPITVCVTPNGRFDPARPAASACIELGPGH